MLPVLEFVPILEAVTCLLDLSPRSTRGQGRKTFRFSRLGACEDLSALCQPSLKCALRHARWDGLLPSIWRVRRLLYRTAPSRDCPYPSRGIWCASRLTAFSLRVLHRVGPQTACSKSVGRSAPERLRMEALPAIGFNCLKEAHGGFVET